MESSYRSGRPAWCWPGLALTAAAPRVVAAQEAPAAAGQAPAAAGPAQPRADVEQIRHELEALRQEYAGRMAAIEARLAAIEGAAASPARSRTRRRDDTGARQPAAEAPTAAVPAGVGGEGAPAALPVYGGSAASSKVFNPDIAAIGNFVGAAGKSPGGGEPSLNLQESELSFQAVVDPYARADFFLTFGPEEVGVEEGYITFPTLPGGLLGKVGKMREAFGRVNTEHPHTLPFADLPLVSREPARAARRSPTPACRSRGSYPIPWLLPRGDGPALPRRVGRLQGPDARRPAVRRPAARLPGHHRVHEPRRRRLDRLRQQRRRPPTRRRGWSAPTSRCATGRCAVRSTRTCSPGARRSGAGGSSRPARSTPSAPTATSATSSRGAGPRACGSTPPSAPKSPASATGAARSS